MNELSPTVLYLAGMYLTAILLVSGAGLLVFTIAHSNTNGGQTGDNPVLWLVRILGIGLMLLAFWHEFFQPITFG
jgi:hypothetical protein